MQVLCDESICKDLATRFDGRTIAVLKRRKNYAIGSY